jgi:hypothetical protein
MEITIRPFFGKIKDFALEYTKAFASMLTGIVTIATSAIFQLHSLWQLNFIFDPYIWHDVTVSNYGKQLFIDGPLYNGTISGATDFFLGMNAVGWVLALVGTFFLMLGVILFYRANLLEVKSILSNNGLDKPLFPAQETP